jgi:hypothetical protein
VRAVCGSGARDGSRFPSSSLSAHAHACFARNAAQVVAPLYRTLVEISPPLKELLTKIEMNRECWVAAGHLHTKRRSLDVKR